jgi:hypothetical protein
MNTDQPIHRLDVRCNCDPAYTITPRRSFSVATRVHADSCPLGQFIATHNTTPPSIKPTRESSTAW